MGQSLRLALSGQSDRTHVCPLLDQSGHSLILALGGLSANDPKRTFSLLATYEVQQKVQGRLVSAITRRSISFGSKVP